MKRPILVISWFFVLLFLYTGGAKLLDINMFREELTSSPLLGGLAGVITWVLPIGEILLAIALLIPAWQLKGLYVTLALMSFFTVYVTILLFMDNHLACSCGGIIEELSPRQHVVFNSVCVVLCAVAIIAARRQVPTAQFRQQTATAAICLFLSVGWVLFAAFSAPAIVKTGMEGRPLPSFNLLLADSVTFLNTENIPGGSPLIAIGFAPSCKHCQAETWDILQHLDSLKNSRILFITSYPFGEMKLFYQYFKLAGHPNIIMGRDTGDFFLRYFRATGVPYTTVYDSKKRLKLAMQSQAHASDLIKAVAE